MALGQTWVAAWLLGAAPSVELTWEGAAACRPATEVAAQIDAAGIVLETPARGRVVERVAAVIDKARLMAPTAPGLTP